MRRQENCFYVSFLSVSPSSFAIIAVPHESPHTFTAVLHMSSILSTATSIPSPSSGSPTALRTIIIVKSPALGIAAAPMEANVAVSMITIWRPMVISMS